MYVFVQGEEVVLGGHSESTPDDKESALLAVYKEASAFAESNSFVDDHLLSVDEMLASQEVEPDLCYDDEDIDSVLSMPSVWDELIELWQLVTVDSGEEELHITTYGRRTQ